VFHSPTKALWGDELLNHLHRKMLTSKVQSVLEAIPRAVENASGLHRGTVCLNSKLSRG